MLHMLMVCIETGCIELCGGVHTAQRPRPRQIPIWFCTHFIRLGDGLCQCYPKCYIDKIFKA